MSQGVGMQSSHRTIALAAALAMAGLAASVQFALAKKKVKQDSAADQMSEQKRAVHALNRLTFGLRPGDVERVSAMGVDKWIDLQLHPERIDDGAVAGRLEPLRTLRMDTREIVENFPPPQMIKAIADSKQSLPSDPTKRAIYQAQLERYYQKQERKQDAAGAGASPASASANSSQAAAMNADSDKAGIMNSDGDAARRESRMYADCNWISLSAFHPTSA